MALPPGTVGLVHPRSGLAARHGVTIVNAPGTVDSGYRGEILVNLVNLDPREPFTVRVGDRIAQLVVQHYLHADFDVADSLPDSARGETGHGSTGGFGLAEPALTRSRPDHISRTTADVSIFKRSKGTDRPASADPDAEVVADEVDADEAVEATSSPPRWRSTAATARST